MSEEVKSRNTLIYEDIKKKTIQKINTHLLVRDISEQNTNKVYFYDPITCRLEVSNLKILREDFKQITFKVLSVPFIYNPSIKNGIVEGKEKIIFNSYNPPIWRQRLIDVSSIPDVYKDFFEHLVLNYKTGKVEEKDLQYIIDWTATTLYPERYLPFLCFVAKKGVGKGIFGNILKSLHGSDNTAYTSQRLFNSSFNSQIMNKTLIHLDEIKIQNDQQENILKLLINNNIEIEGKKKDAYNVDNFASVFITTNNYDIFKITSDERRYSIPYITDLKLEDDEFLMDRYKSSENLVNLLYDPDNISKLGNYLISYINNVPIDFSKPFNSSRTKDIIRASLSEWECEVIKELEGYLENNEATLGFKYIQEILVSRGHLTKPPGRRKFEEFVNKIPELSIHFNNKTREREIKYSKKE